MFAIGVGTAHAAARTCTSADTLTFGRRAVGGSTAASIGVSNCGDRAWSFTDVGIGSATMPAYRIDSTCTTGMTLVLHDQCAISVHFATPEPCVGC